MKMAKYALRNQFYELDIFHFIIIKFFKALLVGILNVLNPI